MTTKREILFRGRAVDTGEWVQGDLSFNRDGVPFIGCWRPLTLGAVYTVEEVDPVTVGQFTGEKDKNEARIFENDILFVAYTGVNKNVTRMAQVVFAEQRFGLEWGDEKEVVGLFARTNITFEVIGNIHDNPEFLEM